MDENKAYIKLSNAGLALEGGGSRGVFTAGVLDVFMEKHIFFPYVAGTSAGACNGIDYASWQIGRTLESFTPDRPETKTLSVRHLLTTGYIYDMDKAFEEFPKKTIPFYFDDYKKSGIKVEMVSANCSTGKPEYLSEYEDYDMMLMKCRASSSLPYVAPIVFIGGTPYMDGGLADSVPYGRLIMKGVEKPVVICTQPYGYRKKMPTNLERIMAKRYEKDYPELTKMILRRPRVYNRQLELLEQLEREGRVFVIRPTEKVLKRVETSVSRINSFYEHGRAVGEAELERMLEFIG